MKTLLTIRSFAYMKINKAFFISLIMILGSNKLLADHDIDLTGNITKLGTDYLVVKGSTLYIDANTELRGNGSDNVPFSFFQLNDLVEVKGNDRGDGTFLATRVRSQDGPGNENEIEFTGFVTQVGTASFVINGNTLFVDSNTEYRGRHGNPFSFDQIMVGMLLEVKASVQSNGDLLATRVENEKDQNHHGSEFEITGNIDSLTSNSIFIGQVEIFVNNQTIIINAQKVPITFGSLSVGNKVEVNAFKQQDSTYFATRIKLEDMHDNEIEVTAQIDNIVGSNIIVDGITFTTDSNTVFLDHNRLSVTIADLSVGMFVEVKGFKRPDSTYYASKIIIQDFIQMEIEIKGVISEMTQTSFVVDGITFSVDSTTRVFDNMNNAILYSDLSNGQPVEVKGEKTGTLTAKALKIKLEGSEDLEIFGKITAVNNDNIELNGLTVFVNAKTVFLNENDLPGTFGDLSVDQFVEVKMVINTDSTLVALSIKIEDGMNISKINGFVGVVNGSSIQLPSGNYLINSKTAVVDNNFNLISNTRLTTGQQVIVWALGNATSNKTALQIQSKISSPTGVNNSPGLVDKFVLQQNYPNPFNPSTTIKYQIPQAGLVTLKIYDLLGRQISTLVNENKTEGNFEVVFDASKLASGIYIYQLKANNFVSSKKMVLLK